CQYLIHEASSIACVPAGGAVPDRNNVAGSVARGAGALFDGRNDVLPRASRCVRRRVVKGVRIYNRSATRRALAYAARNYRITAKFVIEIVAAGRIRAGYREPLIRIDDGVQVDFRILLAAQPLAIVGAAGRIELSNAVNDIPDD